MTEQDTTTATAAVDEPFKVALAPEDLPTDPDEMGSEASDFFGDDEVMVNALIALSYVDPLELSDGAARFTEAQRKLIIDATEIVDGWRS